MLVERLKVCAIMVNLGPILLLTILGTQEPDTSLYKPAIEAIKNFIKTSTSSMTAVPKPLKFLRPHYDDLTKLYEEWPPGDDKVTFTGTRVQVQADMHH